MVEKKFLGVLILIAFLISCSAPEENLNEPRAGEINLAGQASRRVVSNECIDSDNGKNYDLPGTVNYTTTWSDGKKAYKTYSDVCVGSKRIKEYYCMGFVGKNCKYGCQEGACVGKPPSRSAWQVQTSAKKMEIANNNGYAGDILGEPIGLMVSFISDDQLPLLAKGSWRTNGGTYQYQQFLFFQNDYPSYSRSGIVKFAENDNDLTSDFFFIGNGEQIVRYRLEFNPSPESSIVNTYLPDFEGTNLTMLGKEFTITQAERLAPNEVRLTLQDPTRTIVLRDDNILDSAGTYPIQENNSLIEGTKVIIRGVDNGNVFLEYIEIEMTAEDDYFVPAGGKLSDTITAAGEQKEVLFTNNWDIGYRGLTSERNHSIQLSPQADRYNFSWYDGNGKKVTMPLAFLSNNNVLMSEESDSKAVIVKEGVQISRDDYFVITGGSPPAGSAKSYLMQYQGADRISVTNPKIKFRNVGSGETIEYSVSTSGTVNTIRRGGYSFQVINASGMESDNFPILVDLDATFYNFTPSSPVSGSLLEGETRAYTLGSRIVNVDSTLIDSDEAKFRIDNESTPKLQVGNSYNLSSGITITVDSILYQDYAGGVHSADFTLIQNPYLSHLGIRNDIVPIVDKYGAQISFADYPGRLVPTTTMGLTISTPNPDDYDNVKPTDITLTLAPGNSVINLAQQGLVLLTPENEPTKQYGYTSMGGLVSLDQAGLFNYEYPEKQKTVQVWILGK